MLLSSGYMLKTHMMKLISCLVVAGSLAIPAAAGAQSGKQTEKAGLKWKPLELAFSEAQEKDKKVLLDVYTDWCGWCKKLDKDVYGDQRVISYLNQHYTVVKLNAEETASVTYKGNKSTQAELAGSFGVRGYPTIIFFDSKGDPINSLPGYVDADRFLTIVKFIGEDYYKSMSWENYQKKTGSENTKE